MQSSHRIAVNDNVTHALRYDWDEERSNLNVTGRVSHLRVVLHTKPGQVPQCFLPFHTLPSLQAAFEALVEVRYADDEDEKPSLHTRLADISRINSYGHAGDCMSNIDRNMEKYCHCKAP